MKKILILASLVLLVAASCRQIQLQAQVVTASAWLRWTAPGDRKTLNDTALYPVKAYELRFDTLPLSLLSWSSAQVAPGAPAPSLPGRRDSLLVIGLQFSRSYWFAVRSVDSAGNWSGLSNVPRLNTSDRLAPVPVLDLEAR